MTSRSSNKKGRTSSHRLTLSYDAIPVAKSVQDNSSKTVNDKRLYQNGAKYSRINPSRAKKKFRKLTSISTSRIRY